MTNWREMLEELRESLLTLPNCTRDEAAMWNEDALAALDVLRREMETADISRAVLLKGEGVTDAIQRDYVTRQYHMQVIEALVAERNNLDDNLSRVQRHLQYAVSEREWLREALDYACAQEWKARAQKAERALAEMRKALETICEIGEARDVEVAFAALRTSEEQESA